MIGGNTNWLSDEGGALLIQKLSNPPKSKKLVDIVLYLFTIVIVLSVLGGLGYVSYLGIKSIIQGIEQFGCGCNSVSELFSGSCSSKLDDRE